jgi:hypothetical protein
VQTLRTPLLAVVYSTVEYCAPVWLNSVHPKKVDIHLNNAIRLISGTLKSTQAGARELVNCRRHAKSLLFEKFQNLFVRLILLVARS